MPQHVNTLRSGQQGLVGQGWHASTTTLVRRQRPRGCAASSKDLSSIHSTKSSVIGLSRRGNREQPRRNSSRLAAVLHFNSALHNAARGNCDKGRAAERPAATTATWGEGAAGSMGQLRHNLCLRGWGDPALAYHDTGLHVTSPHTGCAPGPCFPASWPPTFRPAPAPPHHPTNPSDNKSTHHACHPTAHLNTSSPPLRIPPPPPPPSRPPTASWAGSCGPPPASWHST